MADPCSKNMTWSAVFTLILTWLYVVGQSSIFAYKLQFTFLDQGPYSYIFTRERENSLHPVFTIITHNGLNLNNSPPPLPAKAMGGGGQGLAETKTEAVAIDRHCSRHVVTPNSKFRNILICIHKTQTYPFFLFFVKGKQISYLWNETISGHRNRNGMTTLLQSHGRLPTTPTKHTTYVVTRIRIRVCGTGSGKLYNLSFPKEVAI